MSILSLAYSVGIISLNDNQMFTEYETNTLKNTQIPVQNTNMFNQLTITISRFIIG